MTKRLVVAFVFLLSAFLVSFSAVRSVERNIEAVLYEIDNNEDIYSCAENVLAQRVNNEKVFSLFLKHTDADMIDKLHISLGLAVESGDDYRIKTLLEDIYSFLSVTLEGEKVKSENIF